MSSVGACDIAISWNELRFARMLCCAKVSVGGFLIVVAGSIFVQSSKCWLRDRIEGKNTWFVLVVPFFYHPMMLVTSPEDLATEALHSDRRFSDV